MTPVLRACRAALEHMAVSTFARAGVADACAVAFHTTDRCRISIERLRTVSRADHRCGIVREDDRHRREVADVAIDDAVQCGDGGLFVVMEWRLHIGRFSY